MNKMIIVTVMVLVSVLGLAGTHAKAAETVPSNAVPAKVSSVHAEAGAKAPRFVEANAKDIGPLTPKRKIELLKQSIALLPTS